MLVYLAMSAATSAEPVGICKSPIRKEEAEEVELVPPAVVGVADEVEVLWGGSFTDGQKTITKYSAPKKKSN